MPRRSTLSATERKNLMMQPNTDDELIRYYTLTEADLSFILQRRGDTNRLGMAIQLCLLRFPGQGLLTDTVISTSLLAWVGFRFARVGSY